MKGLLLLCVVLTSTLILSAAAKRLPEASSTLLRMHRLYQRQSPHDTTLYDRLEVKPNATSAQITRSYRILSRRYHPDKTNDGEERLQVVRDAYDILKEDATRLPYHQYGLTELSDAAFLLTGAKSAKSLSIDQERLMRMMGYFVEHGQAMKLPYRNRVLLLSANLVERIRPLVEDSISTRAFSDSIAQECELLKKLPLGAQILRCIGRAYRHTGQQVLRNKRFKLAGEVSSAVRKKLHKTKHIIEAATAGGKYMVKDKIQQQQQSKRNKQVGNDPSLRIGYHLEDDEDDFDDHDIKQEEHDKARTVELGSLQIEALWKISKIQLDRAIQDACNQVLDGEYFFFPSHASPDKDGWGKGGDGWVSAKGQTISTPIGRLRAASALVLMGDIMVRCAKEP